MTTWLRPAKHWCRRCGFHRVVHVPVALGLDFAIFPCPGRCGGVLETRPLPFGHVDPDGPGPGWDAAYTNALEVIDVNK